MSIPALKPSMTFLFDVVLDPEFTKTLNPPVGVIGKLLQPAGIPPPPLEVTAGVTKTASQIKVKL